MSIVEKYLEINALVDIFNEGLPRKYLPAGRFLPVRGSVLPGLRLVLH